MINRKRYLGIKCLNKKGKIIVTAIIKKRSRLNIGDQIIQIENKNVNSMDDILKISKSFSDKTSIRISIFRQNNIICILEPLTKIPFENEPGYKTTYSQIEYQSLYFRTIFTQKNNSLRPHKIIVFLQGIDCNSIDYSLDSDNPIRKLIYNITTEENSVMRLDLFGNGDSQGDSLSNYSFTDIIQLYESGIRYCYDNKYEVYLFGYSIGGVMAPIIAKDMPDIIHGIIIFDTIIPNLETYLIDNQLRQYILRKQDKKVIVKNMKLYQKMLTYLLHYNLSPQTIINIIPEATTFFSNNLLFLGHNYIYAQQLSLVNIEFLLQKLSIPILFIVGENDYAIDYNAHIRLFHTLKSKVSIRLIILPINHWFETNGFISEDTLKTLKHEIGRIMSKTVGEQL